MAKQVMDLEAQLATMRATVVTLLGQMDALQAQVARADTVQEQGQESAQDQEQVMDDVPLDEMEDGDNELSFDDGSDSASQSGSESESEEAVFR